MLGLILAALTLAAAPAENPVPPVPLDWGLNSAQIASSCDAALVQLRAQIDGITTFVGPRTFTNTILPLENASSDLADTLATQLFLFNVSSDAAVRQASLGCETKVGDSFAEIDADPQLFAAVDAAAASDTAKSVYDRKLTERWMTTLRRSGAGLNPDSRREYVQRVRELTDLESRFGANLASDESTIVITRRQADGIPTDLLATYQRGRDGSYTLPVNESTLSFLEYATDESARRAYYVAYNVRAAKENVPIFERAIAVRDRIAHLLGYETWADYQLADRMAGSSARVEKFLATVTASLHPATQAELNDMQHAIDNDEHDPSAALEPWDVRRAEYLVSKEKASVDADEVRQYFPVQHTIGAVLDIYHILLGVNFTQIVPANAWAPDVFEYQVNDAQTGALLGYTYFDLYPRPGKYEHFANFPILPARVVGGKFRPAVAAIVGNWPKPAPGQPALLSHADVVTFFHEFGHDMAALLATAPYETLSDGFRQDFVEAPSQMLENFAWQPDILKRISSNWKTGEPLPDDLIAKIVASRKTDDAYETTRLLVMSTIDMDYHSMGSHVDTTAVWAKAANLQLPLLYYPGTYPQVSFDHLMGGYDAGLYAYPWAKVYAQDMFTAFMHGNVLDPAVGMRYREDILAPAMTYEPDVEVQTFLGRPMSPDAFYAEFGVNSAEVMQR
jgi:thimet oligopeptidase